MLNVKRGVGGGNKVERLERKLLMRHYGFAKGSPRFTADRQDPTFDNVTNWSLTIDQAPDHAAILRIQTTLLYLCQLYWKDEEPPASGGQSAQWHLRARQSQCSWQRGCIVALVCGGRGRVVVKQARPNPCQMLIRHLLVTWTTVGET